MSKKNDIEFKIDDDDRQHWVENDKYLYSLWENCKPKVRTEVFVKNNRDLIDKYIKYKVLLGSKDKRY